MKPNLFLFCYFEKFFIENILSSFEASYNVRFVVLRYFNACGAWGGSGEKHNPETHLIPLILQVPLGKREKIYINGIDYDTEDGTCVRDYIHVYDLAHAHYLALNYLRAGGKSETINLGTGYGYSVKEVINVCEQVTGQEINKEICGRRAGDAAMLIASNKKAKDIRWRELVSVLLWESAEVLGSAGDVWFQGVRLSDIRRRHGRSK